MNGHLHPPISAGSSWNYHWLNLSIPDIIVVLLMLLVFVLAIVIPFPGGHDKDE